MLTRFLQLLTIGTTLWIACWLPGCGDCDSSSSYSYQGESVSCCTSYNDSGGQDTDCY